MNKEIFKKIKGHKLNALNKKNIKNGRMKIKLNNITNNINNQKEFINYSPITKIKSKSTNKLKSRIVNGMNKFPSIKLPQKKNHNNFHISNNNIKNDNISLNTLKLKNHLHIEDKSKLKIKTNNSFILKNFHSSQNSNKLLLAKPRDNSYNLKRSQHFIKTKNSNLITNPNIGITRHLDRKKLKENKSIILPKHNFKIFKENKIINNNLNKSRDKFKLKSNNNFKKINNLFNFEQKENEIQNIFNRSNLKTEIDEINISQNRKEMKVIDIISDISLSEEELNFSEEDSIDNMEFSLEDEEI